MSGKRGDKGKDDFEIPAKGSTFKRAFGDSDEIIVKGNPSVMRDHVRVRSSTGSSESGSGKSAGAASKAPFVVAGLLFLLLMWFIYLVLGRTNQVGAYKNFLESTCRQHREFDADQLRESVDWQKLQKVCSEPKSVKPSTPRLRSPSQ